MGRAAGGPLDHHHRVRAGRGGRPEGRHAREDVRRLEGHGPARLRRPGDHRPDPRRPGHGRADRDPDRGLLPLDRVGPPFRAERPVARRGRAARPPPGVDQRRRPGHEPRPQEARQGAPRPEHAAATGTPAGSRSPRRPSSRRQAAVDQGELALAQLERDRDALSGARDRRTDAETGPGRAPQHCSRRPARPSGVTAERDAAAGALRALPPGGRRRRRAGRRSTAAIRRRNPLPVLETGVERLRDARRPDPRAAGGPVGRDRGHVRRRAGADLAAALARLRWRSSSIGILLAGGPVRPRVPRDRRAGRRRPGGRRDHRGRRPRPRRGRPVAPPQRRASRPSCATSRSTGACAAGRTWKPSSSIASCRRRRSSARSV